MAVQLDRAETFHLKHWYHIIDKAHTNGQTYNTGVAVKHVVQQSSLQKHSAAICKSFSYDKQMFTMVETMYKKEKRNTDKNYWVQIIFMY